MTWLRSTGLRLVLAIGLGFALWVFVENNENPDRQAQFKDRQVVPRGLAPGLVIVDQNGLPNPPLPPATITAEAAREALAAGNNDVEAYVDLRGLGPADHIVPVNARVSLQGQQPDVVEITPAFLTIRIEQIVTRTVPLTVELTGSVPFSFEAGQATITDQERPVTQTLVTGPRSRVDRVAFTRAMADINGLTANYDSPRRLEAIAADGQVVEGVTIKPQSVNVRVPIISIIGLKRVPVVPRVTGEPASGYIVEGVSVDPQFVRLTGSAGPLESVQSIETQDVDISGATRTISRTTNLQKLPLAGLSFGEPVSATVTVRIAPIMRSFQVSLPASVQIDDAGSGLLASVNPQIVQVTVSGTAAQLEALATTPIQATVSTRGLSVGAHVLVPSFALPQGVSLVGRPPTVTLTLRAPPTAVPTEPPPTPTVAPPAAEPPTEIPRPTVAPTAAPTTAPIAYQHRRPPTIVDFVVDFVRR